jgi:hypothetical protein
MLRLGARLPGLTIALGALVLVIGIVRGMVILDALGTLGLIAGGAGLLTRGRTRR